MMVTFEPGRTPNAGSSSPEPPRLNRLPSCTGERCLKDKACEYIGLACGCFLGGRHILEDPGDRWAAMVKPLQRVRRRVYDRPMPELTAFILAGGKSTRMGVDKVFVELDGRTLLARALELARGLASDVRIVGDVAKFAKFGPVVEDIFQNCGPLGGIHAALRASATDLNLILAVDVPFVAAQFLSYMIEQAANCSSASAVVPRAAGGWQPLCAVYRRSFAEGAETALRAGRNKIDRLFNLLEIRVIDEDELVRSGFSLDIFRNLNTPEELEVANTSRRTR